MNKAAIENASGKSGRLRIKDRWGMFTSDLNFHYHFHPAYGTHGK